MMSTAGYLTSTFFSGKVIARIGVGRVLAWSCTLTGLALISYTLVPQWWMMVLLGIFAGSGRRGDRCRIEHICGGAFR